jgi:hypothetical protein
MSKYVLPTILTVDEVLALPDNILELLTEISTGIILESINEFVEKNKNSQVQNDREAALKLERIYKETNDVNAYLESDEAKSLADTLAALQYSDVSASTDLDTLKMYRKLIIELLSDDEDFVKEYFGSSSESSGVKKKTAYTAKLDNDNLERVVKLMSQEADGDPVVLGLISKINKNKNKFKNGNYNVNKPTVLRKAIYKKDKLRNILKGLDFLIPKLESGQSPVTWRRL